MILDLRALIMCLHGLYGACNCYGLVRQVSRFIFQFQRVEHMSYSRLLGSSAEKRRVIRHVKPLRCGMRMVIQQASMT